MSLHGSAFSNMSVGNPREAEANRQRSEKALKACELYYVEHLSQKEIAKQLKISPASVSRLLRYGRDVGLVRVSICPPNHLQRARQLRTMLGKYGVRDIVVAGTARKHVGCAAAAYFETHGASGDIVVLDGGLTVGAFVDAFPTGVFRAMTLVPICADPPGYDASACELAARLSTKFSEPTRKSIPQYRGRERLDKIYSEVVAIAHAARFVFLGTGPWRPGFTAMEFIEYLGLDPRKVRQRKRHIVALCGYCAIDRDGRHVPLKPVDEKMPRSLQFEDLRALAQSDKCWVILLAHSDEKRDAVLSVMKARLCNTLIIDEELANALAETQGDNPESPSTLRQ